MPSYSTMDLEAHSYEVHTKPYMHNFTLNLCDLRTKLLWASYVLHKKFIWTSNEFRMKWNQIYSYEFHKKFIWTSYGVQMNFSRISYEIKSNLFTWIYMQFVWSSYVLHIEELIKLICYAHVIQTRWYEAHKQFAWNTHAIHINFEWFELHLNFINIAWQEHKNFLCTTHEYGLWHPRYVLHMNDPPGSAFIKPDKLDPWIKDQIKNTLLPTNSQLLLPNFVSCGRACPSHMTQNLVTVGAKLWTAERFLVDPWSTDYADPVW